MPEQNPYPNESKEDYKERIKKLKAKTSKMRLAFVGPGYKAPKGFIPDLSPENMKKLNNITVGLACLVLSTGVMAQGVTDDEVVLGTSTALSGPAALWGVSASRAAQIRFDMVNAVSYTHLTLPTKA